MFILGIQQWITSMQFKLEAHGSDPVNEIKIMNAYTITDDQDMDGIEYRPRQLPYRFQSEPNRHRW